MNQPVVDTWEGEDRFWDIPQSIIQDQCSEVPFKAVMGENGIVVWNPEIDPVGMLDAYLTAIYEESCGQCTPCRLGTAQIKALSTAICSGKGKETDLDRICAVADHVSQTARCDLGRTFAKPVTDLITRYKQAFLDAIQGKRTVRPGKYEKRITAPCIHACPAHVDIPAYLENVRMGRYKQAMKIVRQGCPMPGTIGRVCVRPCEANCRRKDLDDALSIRAVKRFLADKEMEGAITTATPPEKKFSEKVAIVGAGPAGLSCAYYLGKQGYKTTIFESHATPGGMAAYGIPEYRLPREVIAHEAGVVEQLGAEIRYDTTIGKDLSVEDLTRDGYKAVFLGMGAPQSSKMRCEGEDAGYQGFMTGVDFLEASAKGSKPLEGNTVVVVGGGNVAMDCVRTSKRHGFKDVVLLYRRTEKEMPADPHEIREAKEEGVEFRFLVAPVRIVSENHRVIGIECLKMELGAPDDSGRRRPVPMKGSAFIIDCDAVIPAVGQVCVVDRVVPDDESIVTAWKTLVVNETTCQSDQKHIFGGGDCVTGPQTLIAALFAGKKAAHSIHKYLHAGACAPDISDVVDTVFTGPGLFLKTASFPYPGYTNKTEGDVLEPDTRIEDFSEVQFGLSVSQARQEAERCLRCYRMMFFAL